jgi:hypothetical protein
MTTKAQITEAASGLNMMEAYGMINASQSGLAISVLNRIAEAEDVNVALDQAIAKWTLELEATADWGLQNRISYTLDTLNRLK